MFPTEQGLGKGRGSSVSEPTAPYFNQPDQLDPKIKDQPKIFVLFRILPLQLRNFVSCGRACPSHVKKLRLCKSKIVESI